MDKEKRLVIDVLPPLTVGSAALLVVFGLGSLLSQFNTDEKAGLQKSFMYFAFAASTLAFIGCVVYSRIPDKAAQGPARPVTPAVRSVAAPAIARTEIDALKARLLGLVNRRDEELEALADSNEPAEVKEEKARALLERYNRDIAGA
jgi:hypothetical protein